MTPPRSARIPLVDAHVDYAMGYLDARDTPNLPQVPDANIRDLRGALLSVWARWPEMRADVGDALFRDVALSTIDTALALHRTLGGSEVASREDLAQPLAAPLLLHHLEGADLLDPEPKRLTETLHALARRGIRSITPVYSGGNEIGGGSNEVDASGLTRFGTDALDVCAAFGLAIDTAHMNYRTRADVLRWAEERKVPVHYTHGGLEKWTRFPSGRVHQRGIPGEQAAAVIASGGIVGISPSMPFVHSRSEYLQSLDTVLALPRGERGLAVGTDFGGVPPEGLLPRMGDHRALIETLQREFRTPALLRAIAAENLLAALGRSLETRSALTALRIL